MSPLFFMLTAVSTACSRLSLLIPATTKQPVSRASGLSVEVRMLRAAIGLPMDVKKLDSSGKVPESDTTA